MHIYEFTRVRWDIAKQTSDLSPQTKSKRVHKAYIQLSKGGEQTHWAQRHLSLIIWNIIMPAKIQLTIPGWARIANEFRHRPLDAFLDKNTL